MTDFINTIDLLGDDVVAKKLIEGTIEEFHDDTVEYVGEYKFFMNPTISNVKLPAVTDIGQYAFCKCTALTSADISNVTHITGRSVFDGCTSLLSADLPNVTEVADTLFDGCTKLGSANLPKAQKLGSYTFRGCALKSIVLPLVTSMTYTFERCSKLTDVDLPKLTHLSYSIFNYCSSLKAVALRSETLCALSGTSVFNYSPFASGGKGGRVLVPRALIESYQTATNWSTLYAAGTCIFLALEDWTIDGTITGKIDPNKHWVRFYNNDSTLLQSGIVLGGEMPIYNGDEPVEPSESGDYFNGWTPEIGVATKDVDYVAKYTPSSYARAYLRGAPIGDYVNDTIKIIQSYSFYKHSTPINMTFTKATKIMDYAFCDHSGIESASFPLVTIVTGSSTFKNASKLKNIGLPKAEEINGFQSCISLEHVDFPSCKTAGYYLLSGCKKLKSANFPVLNTISMDFLKDCTALESVRLPATPPTINSSGQFSNINAACVFYIPTGSLAAYQANSWWSNIVNQYSFVEEDRE